MERRALLQAGVFLGLAAAVGCRPELLNKQVTQARGAQPQAVEPPEPPPVPDPQPEPDSDAVREPDPEPPPEVLPEPEPEPTPEDEPADEPGVAALRVEVICRDALGLSAPIGVGAAHAIDRMMLHHTAVELGDNALAPGRLRGHQRFHQQQGWADIAYHYGVDLRGNLYELRTPEWAGDTFTEYDPAGHFLVVCEGNYDLEQPTDAMLQGTVEILAHAVRAFGADPWGLTGHRDLAATTCPGDNLYVRLDEVRAEVARLASAPVALESVCGPEAQQRVAAIEQG